MTAKDETLWSLLAPILRTFAAQPRNWLVLARNLVPVVGVYALAWSDRITLLSYWVDGVCLLALLLAAVFIRGMAVMHRERGHGLVAVTLQGFVAFALFFFLLGIPYWMVYDELDLGVPMWQVSESRALTIGIWSIVVVAVIASLTRGGYFGKPMEAFRKDANAELEVLATRGVAMMIVAAWTKGVLMVPLFALVLTAFEVWPQLRSDLRREAGAIEAA